MMYPEIDPVIISLGPLAVRWYGLMYLFGFAGAWWLGRTRLRAPQAPFTVLQFDDLIFYAALGVVLGGRLGYVLFYNLPAFLAEPWILLRVWEGGMSFHGGLLGVLVASLMFARKVGIRFFVVTDFLAPLVPVGLLSGRIGNFINGELWGAPGDVPWAMQVACAGRLELCQGKLGLAPGTVYTPALHPTQLYEAALEGLLLFALLWWFSARARPRMAVSGLFLLIYATFRFGVEFMRMPDAHLGYLAFGWLTMGQLLSLPMMGGGILLIVFAYLKSPRIDA